MAEHRHEHPVAGTDPAAHWEARYAGADPIWSGRPNASLVAVAPLLGGGGDGLAVDLGCGEGGDAIWLAGAGFRVIAADISATAVARGRAAAADRGLADAIEWVVADLETWTVPAEAGLVVAAFLQSDLDGFDRTGILRRAAGALPIGGRLLAIAHAGMPPWSPHAGEPGITPEAELTDLALDPAAWAVDLAELREREATGPDGEPAVLTDSVVLVRRTG